MKIIEVIADAAHRDTISGIAEQHEIEDLWFGANNEDGRISARMLVRPENRPTCFRCATNCFEQCRELPCINYSTRHGIT